MVCQSDYDNEIQDILRQVDECVEEWWGESVRSTDERAQEIREAEPTRWAAETEAIRRGLLKHDGCGGLCIACPEGND